MTRQSVIATLNSQTDISVTAEAADGLEALYLFQPSAIDVCVVDIRMPGVSGVELARRWAGPELPRRTPVLLLTSFDEPDTTYLALRSGAAGFLLKGTGSALLIEGVRAASRGESIISPGVAARIIERIQDQGLEAARLSSPITPREQDVLELVARGATNSAIANSLFLSLSTVKLHVASLRSKLGARNRTELAAWAHESGLVSPR